MVSKSRLGHFETKLEEERREKLCALGRYALEARLHSHHFNFEEQATARELLLEWEAQDAEKERALRERMAEAALVSADSARKSARWSMWAVIVSIAALAVALLKT